ncbi:MAG: integrase [Pusillimonas sp.]|nr:integrase [Pusillimonas sp.]
MSIYREKTSGRFIFEFDRTIEGKRVRTRKRLPSAWSKTQAHAFDRKESARLYGIASGVERHRYTIEEAVEQYIKDKSSLKSLKSAAEHLGSVMWAYEGRFIDELPAVAQEIAGNAPQSPATIKNRIALLRAACRWAWKKHGMADRDPAERLQLPSVKNERHVYIDVARLHRIIRHCKNEQARKVIVVAFYSGMRLSEILRSTIEGGSFIVLDTKNGDPIRRVPMHPRLETYIKTWPPACAKKTVQKWFQLSRDKAGLREVHFHDLRHSTASALVNSDVDLYTVGAILGHKDPRSTMRYAHLEQARLKDAINKIGKKKAA